MPGLLVYRLVFDGTPVVDLAVIGFTSAFGPTRLFSTARTNVRCPGAQRTYRGRCPTAGCDPEETFAVRVPALRAGPCDSPAGRRHVPLGLHRALIRRILLRRGANAVRRCPPGPLGDVRPPQRSALLQDPPLAPATLGA